MGRLRLPQELGEQQGHSRDIAAPADVSPGEMQGMLQFPQCQISAAGPSPLPPARSPGSKTLQLGCYQLCLEAKAV